MFTSLRHLYNSFMYSEEDFEVIIAKEEDPIDSIVEHTSLTLHENVKVNLRSMKATDNFLIQSDTLSTILKIEENIELYISFQLIFYTPEVTVGDALQNVRYYPDHSLQPHEHLNFINLHTYKLCKPETPLIDITPTHYALVRYSDIPATVNEEIVI